MVANLRNEILQAIRDGLGQPLTTNKSVITTAQGGHYGTFQSAGTPGAGSYSGTALTAVQLSSSTTGAVPFSNASASKKLFLVAGNLAASNTSGTFRLWDLLLYYPGINHATAPGAQTLTNGVTLPRYTTGQGVAAFLEVTTGLGATAQNVTLSYTNQASTAGRSTGAQAIVTSSSAGRFPHAFLQFPTQGTDTGIKSVESVTFSAASTGTSALILARILAEIPVYAANIAGRWDYESQMDLPQIFDSACLAWTFSANATATTPLAMGGLNLVSLDA